jgi:hypothetical protein
MQKLLGLLAIGSLLYSPTFAQSTGSASFSESYADKLISYKDEGETYYEQVSSGRFTTRGKATLEEPLDPSYLDEETPFSIQIGDWSYEGFLGDDPKFTSRKKSASIKLDTGAILKIAFTTKSITWSVSGKTGYDFNGEYETSPLASSYAGSDESYSIKKSDGETISCSASLGDGFVSGELPLSGRVKSTIKRIGSGDFEEEYPLSSVSLSASGKLEESY